MKIKTTLILGLLLICCSVFAEIEYTATGIYKSGDNTTSLIKKTILTNDTLFIHIVIESEKNEQVILPLSNIKFNDYDDITYFTLLLKKIKDELKKWQQISNAYNISNRVIFFHEFTYLDFDYFLQDIHDICTINNGQLEYNRCKFTPILLISKDNKLTFRISADITEPYKETVFIDFTSISQIDALITHLDTKLIFGGYKTWKMINNK